ncbi:Cytochrome c oxidase subunit 7A- protein, mitochondrial [Desmophyllum pertusum]|uniref:Cytochrome c oxidase subunit 7A- protein, mitochondrial n=1 Tax=Desmophyllum pertusum TaxID=174260 RepID=A0A9W9ZV25_9CNID|nr:Cytochrome c oxidase subunit 7A- protein, mitochondrial [Desmophyllum pertusum]
MFYKQNSFAGKLIPAEAAAAYQPQGLGGYKEVKTGPVIEAPMSSSSAGVNTVRQWQDIFKKSKNPVFLIRGMRDVVVYRGFMGVVAVGAGFACYYYAMMATGKLKRKERPH